MSCAQFKGVIRPRIKSCMYGYICDAQGEEDQGPSRSKSGIIQGVGCEIYVWKKKIVVEIPFSSILIS